MNNFKFLLIGTSLSFIPTLSYAQCVATQDCATLGYTETSCNGGKGVKCPFGNKWACLGADEKACCTKNGFKYTCTGTGYSGGNGDSCDGKYKKCNCSNGYNWSKNACQSCSTSFKYTCTGSHQIKPSSGCGGKYDKCNCSEGYEWKDERCQKKEIINGADGDVYKCNGKVVAVKTSNMNFYIAMEDLGKIEWFRGNESCSSYLFCNSAKGTFPSSDQMLLMYNNKSLLNSRLSTNGGKSLTEDNYWSSTNLSDGPIYVDMEDGGTQDWNNSKDNKAYIRCILTSW